MKMAAEMDAGDIIDIQKYPLALNTTVREFIGDIEKRGPGFLNETLIAYAHKELIARPQNHQSATFCGKISKEDWQIKIFSDSLETIFNKYRGYSIWPWIWFETNDLFKNPWKRVLISRIIVDEKTYSEQKNKLFFDWEELNKAIKEVVLKVEGKKEQSFDEFKNWYLR